MIPTLALLALTMGWGQQPTPATPSSGIAYMRKDSTSHRCVCSKDGEAERPCTPEDMSFFQQHGAGSVQSCEIVTEAPETTAPELPIETCTDAPFSCIDSGTNTNRLPMSETTAPELPLHVCVNPAGAAVDCESPNAILRCKWPEGCAVEPQDAPKPEWIGGGGSGTFYWSGPNLKEPKPIDVPAIEQIWAGNSAYIQPCPSTAVKVDYDMKKNEWKCTMRYCADPSRYLLGPNGNGEYICHRSQKEN